MNSKERVIKAIEFDDPDRVPNGCYTLPIPSGPRANVLKRLFDKYPSDFAEAKGMARSLDWDCAWQKGCYTDEWGVVRVNLQDGVIGQPVTHPLTEWETLETYSFPDPLNGMEAICNSVNEANHEKYLLASGGSIWHTLHALRGYENVLMDIVLERKKIRDLIDQLVDFHIHRLDFLLDLEIDGVMFGDDWGTQRKLMIRPEKWRQYFKPAYGRLFDKVRRKRKQVFFHSDGYVMDIISDLIEIGANAANIQVSLMGIEKVAHLVRGKMCIAADVDRQKNLPFGTAEEVNQLVKDIILSFKGLGGGLILYGEIGPDVTPQNAESMLKALQDYGEQV